MVNGEWLGILLKLVMSTHLLLEVLLESILKILLVLERKDGNKTVRMDSLLIRPCLIRISSEISLILKILHLVVKLVESGQMVDSLT
uniref:Uncharacterized protein n=1 Tax=virus sp. ctBM815 TaxID=2825806 RepID=A0A8S5RKC0_9VIRU|nr:MAG TPA: hypothetical protein [virus sp. ctBM815]